MKNTLIIMILGLLVLAACTQVVEQPVEVVELEIEETSNEESVTISKGETIDIRDGKYSLNTELSELRWYSEKISGSSHEGTVDFSSGTLVREEGNFITGLYVVDMTTISDVDNNGRLVGHLMNEDFFDVENYPESSFEIESITHGSEGYLVKGDLSILETTRTISFPANLDATEDGLHVTAEFEIDRTAWGIQYGSGKFFKELGDKTIKDEVLFGLDLVFE